MNKSSSSIVTVEAPETVYEGLLTSVSITVEQIETTQTGLLGIFLLSSMNGAGDTPSDQGCAIVSNSEGGSENYVEVTVNPGQSKHTVTWPSVRHRWAPMLCTVQFTTVVKTEAMHPSSAHPAPPLPSMYKQCLKTSQDWMKRSTRPLSAP